MATDYGLTVYFDNGIETVSFQYGSNEYTFTNSGAIYGFSLEPESDIVLTANLKAGYSLESSSFGTVTGNNVTIAAENMTANMTCTLTSKSSTPRLSVDVSTLAGWDALSAGARNITVVAKADGYKDSAPSAAVSVTKAASMPAKGDIITLDSKQYRVLKTEGTVAEVLAMYDATASQKFGSSQTYANSDLDTYCNTTFYNSLSSAMQNAIVTKTFQQDSWQWSGGSSAIANYAGVSGSGSNYTVSLMSSTFGATVSRKCYTLSCQDVIDYLGVTPSMTSDNTTLTSENVWKMFWNQITSPNNTYPWLRSACTEYTNQAFYVRARFGSLNNTNVDLTDVVRPAFQIDLSKISWSK